MDNWLAVTGTHTEDQRPFMVYDLIRAKIAAGALCYVADKFMERGTIYKVPAPVLQPFKEYIVLHPDDLPELVKRVGAGWTLQDLREYWDAEREVNDWNIRNHRAPPPAAPAAENVPPTEGTTQHDTQHGDGGEV